jgi:hypothetical protein
MIDYFAFFKYTLFWIAPTVMFTSGVGALISIIFGNGVAAIPVQFMLWMNSLMPLRGDYGLTKLVIRFNTAGAYEEYIGWVHNIGINRIFYVLISAGLVLIGTWVWSLKRGAGSGVFKKHYKARAV